MKKTQREIVIDELRKQGCITRNLALKLYITRLGAIINDLKKEGWEFESYYHKIEHGNDYVYKVKKAVTPSPINKILNEWRNDQKLKKQENLVLLDIK